MQHPVPLLALAHESADSELALATQTDTADFAAAIPVKTRACAAHHTGHDGGCLMDLVDLLAGQPRAMHEWLT